MVVEHIHLEFSLYHLILCGTDKLKGTRIFKRSGAEKVLTFFILGDIRTVAIFGKNDLIFSAEPNGHTCNKLLLLTADVNERSGSIAAYGDVGNGNLNHIFAVAKLIEIPLLASPLRMSKGTVVFKNVMTRPAAAHKQIAVGVEKLSRMRILHLITFFIKVLPAYVRLIDLLCHNNPSELN